MVNEETHDPVVNFFVIYFSKVKNSYYFQNLCKDLKMCYRVEGRVELVQKEPNYFFIGNLILIVEVNDWEKE